VLPYFRRSEGKIGPGDAAFHGREGPLSVSDVTERHPLCEAYVAAAREIGLPFNPDINGASQEGVGYFQTTSRNGVRVSAAKAFLKPAMRRPNLRVITHALAERVLFANTRATGVAYSQEGVRKTVRAKREVILCGGAINSPQLLMLSGIGPAGHLQEIGIEPLLDLPGVGQNLQDHYQTRFSYRCTEAFTVNDVMTSRVRMVRAGLQYILARKGPLAISAGQVTIFAKTRPEVATPDIQFHFIPFSGDRPASGLHAFSGFTQNVCQLRPESRGEIRLKSRDPAAHPAISPNYLATETDRRTLVDGLKMCRALAERPAMRRYIVSEYLPGDGV
jgi:choline dehydrogenase